MDKSIPLVQLVDGEGFLLRPVLNQLIRYESLIDCTLDLADIATFNEALDVREENQRRVNDYHNSRR